MATGEELPKIIAFNEARVAHDRLIHVKADIDDAVDMMVQVMDATRQAPRKDGGEQHG